MNKFLNFIIIAKEIGFYTINSLPAGQFLWDYTCKTFKKVSFDENVKNIIKSLIHAGILS